MWGRSPSMARLWVSSRLAVDPAAIPFPPGFDAKERNSWSVHPKIVRQETARHVSMAAGLRSVFMVELLGFKLVSSSSNGEHRPAQ